MHTPPPRVPRTCLTVWHPGKRRYVGPVVNVHADSRVTLKHSMSMTCVSKVMFTLSSDGISDRTFKCELMTQAWRRRQAASWLAPTAGPGRLQQTAAVMGGGWFPKLVWPKHNMINQQVKVGVANNDKMAKCWCGTGKVGVTTATPAIRHSPPMAAVLRDRLNPRCNFVDPNTFPSRRYMTFYNGKRTKIAAEESWFRQNEYLTTSTF